MFRVECVAKTVPVMFISMPFLTELVSMEDGVCYKHGAPNGAWRRSMLNMALLTELALDNALWKPVGAMANTYTQIYIQVVFAVQGRQSLVRPERKEELQKYMTGIVSRQGQKLIAIHCMLDHTHVLIGLRPNIALSDLVGDIKTGSTNHINEQRWVPGRFSWQEGFGAFSYSHSQLKGVIDYIRDQVAHHARKTFRQEYLAFLKKYEVSHDERYIFRPVDEE
jgi:REP element-mobilizing transposase RayT